MRCIRVVVALATSLLTGLVFAQGLQVEPYTYRSELSRYYAGGELLEALRYRGPDHSTRVFAIGFDNDRSLHAYGLLEDHGGFLTRWEIKEPGNPFCDTQPWTDRMGVQDPLGDGQALALLAYTMRCNGINPTQIKLIMVYRDRRYTILGHLPDEPDVDLTPKANADFAELPPRVQKFAWDYWAAFEQEAAKRLVPVSQAEHRH
jgi:hypothetical protein